MTGLEQSHHMCDMSEGIFEAKAKLFGRRGLGFEDETEATAFNNWTMSFVKNRGFNWLTAVCLISCRFLRAEKEALWKHSDSVFCYKFHGKSSFVGRSPSRAEWEHGNCCAMFWGRISEGALQVSAFLGTSTIPSPRLAWFLVGPAPNHMEKAYGAKKQTFKFAWRAQNARRLWVGCNGSSLCMVLVWRCRQRSHTMSLTRLLRTERSAWAHLKAQMLEK